MDDRALLHYKFTLKAFGSSEVIRIYTRDSEESPSVSFILIRMNVTRMWR